MLINQIVWELDSLCFSLRYIVHISAWQSRAIYFPLYFIFVHAAQVFMSETNLHAQRD